MPFYFSIVTAVALEHAGGAEQRSFDRRRFVDAEVGVGDERTTATSAAGETGAPRRA